MKEVNNMIPGTTPYVRCNLPFGVDMITKAEFTIEYFAGSKRELIVKHLSDSVSDGPCLYFPLTQEETLKFPDNSWVNIQLRLLTTDGKVLATSPHREPVGRLLIGGVIG